MFIIFKISCSQCYCYCFTSICLSFSVLASLEAIYIYLLCELVVIAITRNLIFQIFVMANMRKILIMATLAGLVLLQSGHGGELFFWQH